MLRDGKTAKEVASELNVAYKTVDNLRAYAYQRMKVNKLAGMIKWLNDNKL
jgi:FixJ family two-component response regulator